MINGSEHIAVQGAVHGTVHPAVHRWGQMAYHIQGNLLPAAGRGIVRVKNLKPVLQLRMGTEAGYVDRCGVMDIKGGILPRVHR